ncbi:peptidylprolyl isomerase [Paraflavitalea sp. CAU 1676]|uniref:peptidylprolyl isomerase n=1 Tax=Paraflavitalea sp. CAU 1676 TaxID=3032598 RepID=UPI0023DC5B47|nr:peptidylprolyl isomerase [Paraflavitalea sp. CAU 1676]MDF2191180.1 peptidylprolyl isomerase [Paraflavitalea sp. CAU 1676]
MAYRNLLAALMIFFAGCASNKYKNPHIEIETKIGDIEVELYPAQAPKTVAAFLAYIEAGYYKDVNFYRVLNADNQPSNAPKAELIQGGLYGTKRPDLPGIPHETTQQTKILHKDGTISLARLEPGTANTEFFICIGDQPGFDFGGENNPDKQGYAAFGRVIKGMDIVRRIYNMPEEDQRFDPPVPIYSIKKL